MNTLSPSRGPKGRRLKKARNAFMNAMEKKRVESTVEKLARTKNIAAMKIFVAGPATEILPLSSSEGAPAITTAPGAANTIPKNMPKKRANISP